MTALISTLLLSATLANGAINQSCAKSTGAEPDRTVHGRLSIYNGGYPNFRLWQIGTHHMYGIVQNAADRECARNTPCAGGDDGPLLPANIEKLIESTDVTYWRLYGNFRLRPLRRNIKDHQQAACILSAQHLALDIPK
jgi:hypothetical protein